MQKRDFFYLFLGFTLGSILGFIVGILPSLREKTPVHEKHRHEAQENESGKVSAHQALYNRIREKIMRQAPTREVRGEYQNLKALEPQNIQIPLSLGMVYYQMENLDETLFYLQEALLLEPTNMLTLTYLARVYERSQKNLEAASIYEKLLKQLPEGHQGMLLKKIESLKQSVAAKAKDEETNNQPLPIPSEEKKAPSEPK